MENAILKCSVCSEEDKEILSNGRMAFCPKCIVALFSALNDSSKVKILCESEWKLAIGIVNNLKKYEGDIKVLKAQVGMLKQRLTKHRAERAKVLGILGYIKYKTREMLGFKVPHCQNQMPVVPLPFLKGPKSVDPIAPEVPGVYFFWGQESGSVDYVGQSSCLANRVHCGHEKLLKTDWVSWIEFPSSEVLFAESFYIWQLRPFRNFNKFEKSALVGG